MGKQYNDIQIKNMLELSVDVCNINILIGSGFSMPTFPNMEQVQTLIKLLLQYFLDSNILNTLEDTDDLKKLNNFLEVNKINELFLNLKEKINYSNWDSKKINELIVSLEDKNMNFENLLYKDHLNNYLNNDKDKTGIREYNLSFLFVNLFFWIVFNFKKWFKI
ncbi:MAG: hypothetical protein OHM56_03135 [Spiroplasma phoeniceum]|nr:MAG: hypothetical protein OHM57_02590 [Spiroplasma phoeniceum]UZQ32960.1 MAG: hypothetical protein OHM56_03135 [Spiroplasma phoeniceum]